MNNPLKYFAELRDPRVERTREHLLEEILLMTIAAVLSGAGSWNEIEGYGKAKRLWFKGFLKLPGGIPSHDTTRSTVSSPGLIRPSWRRGLRPGCHRLPN